MYKSSVAIIGLMTSYNAGIAKMLAEKLEMMFLDGTSYVEYELLLPPPAYIKKHGKRLFDYNEAQCYKRFSGFENCLFAPGAYAVRKIGLLKKMKKYCYMLYVTGSNELITNRFVTDKAVYGGFRLPADLNSFALAHKRLSAVADAQIDVTDIEDRDAVQKLLSALGDITKV